MSWFQASWQRLSTFAIQLDLMSLFGGLWNRKASAAATDFSFLGTDMHSHLIPGVDDGVPDMETSLSLIRKLHNCGYHTLITTPHIFQDYYPNNTEILHAGYAKVKQALKKQQIPVTIRVAAEYYLDMHVMDLLEENVPLLTLADNKVLIEFSMLTPPLHRDEFLFQLRVKGYEPVIAHVERYSYYHQQFDQYQYLYEKGFALQLNLLSFTGQYGKKIQKTAHQLLEKGWVKYLGTDLHHYRHAAGLQQLQNDRRLMQKLGAYPWENKNL